MYEQIRKKKRECRSGDYYVKHRLSSITLLTEPGAEPVDEEESRRKWDEDVYVQRRCGGWKEVGVTHETLLYPYVWEEVHFPIYSVIFSATITPWDRREISILPPL